ncbi:hypothetical protein [Aquabacter cavernae]|uniref:hypothetical protein n=1 Tax=Aquabacter cavernae TaxID=2496029 RepID=UPI000F8D96F8|nr:hypothetical protein [Aquabacter cavernae]
MINALGSRWKGVSAVAWAIAYALVFQLVLTSTLIASQTAATGADPAQICFGALPDASEHGGADDTAQKAVHCPLCLPRADAAILPIPPAIADIQRRQMVVELRGPEGISASPLNVQRKCLPRGPPASV